MDWSYDAWPSGEPYSWDNAERGTNPWDLADFHVDLGCGRVKKGRIGVDRYAAPGVNVLMDLDRLRLYSAADEPGADAPAAENERFAWPGLPFGDGSIESIVTHHCFEHIGNGFIGLMEECCRVLKRGAPLRVIVPLFPSWSAVSDPDHRRYFMADEYACTLDSFCGQPGPGGCWLESFSVPYTTARFQKVDQWFTPAPPEDVRWTSHDARELRVTLVKS